MAQKSGNLADEFELAFQNCLTTLNTQEHFDDSNPDDMKLGAEQNIHAFLEKAREMEAFFLQRRTLLSVHRPEQMVKEEIQDLKAELLRKEAILDKYSEKLKIWPTILQTDVQQQATTTSSNYSNMSPGMAQHPSAGGGGGPMGMDVGEMMPPSFSMSNAYLQGKGPLSYLEQTTSSIGMPERR